MDEPKLPRVAIIIANYNYGQWIADALKSAVGQDYPNKEIVIIDDASTDDSFNVVNALVKLEQAEDDDEKTIFRSDATGVEITFIRLKQNGGPSRARNIGIAYVFDRCHLFAMLDADDAFLQGKISKCVTKILEFPDIVGAVYTDYLHMSENGVLSYESKEPYSRERLVQECIVHSGCVVNKLAISKVGGYNPNLRVCEDYNLWLRISNNFIFTHIPEYLHLVRVGQHQSSTTVDKQRWENDYILAKRDALGLL